MKFRLIIPAERPKTIVGGIKRLWQRVFGKPKPKGVVRICK